MQNDVTANSQKPNEMNASFALTCSKRAIWSYSTYSTSTCFPLLLWRQQDIFFILQHIFAIMKSPLPFLCWVRAASLFLCLTQTVLAKVLTNSTRLESILEKYRDKDEEWWRVRPRGKRAISEGDMHLILDLHNKLRGQVHPPASNMEYMVSAANTADCCTVYSR